MSHEEAAALLRRSRRVHSAAAISRALTRLAREITARLAGRFPLVLSVMRGGVVFAGRLLPELAFPLEFDYLDVTRYAGSTRGGEISWRVSPGTSVAGRAVLVLDDILDEGATLAAVRERLIRAGAAEVLCAVLAEKERRGTRPLRPDFIGVTVPDRYVFGFGMDVRGAWRNLPAIYALGAGDE
ncbi:MAG: hypoxanthine-guanine phosphoribosyltransferase [Burkholderiales bacterium]|nr:hypoxanthine-guanine phosphoribosyltransferase [Burkholderiales bacterium]